MSVTINSDLTSPKSPYFHLFQSEENFLLDVENGRILQVSNREASALEMALKFGDVQRSKIIASQLGVLPKTGIEQDLPDQVPVRSVSLAIAQKCNLGCTYCYAEQGTFGENPNNMSEEVAKATVDQILSDAKPGEKITVAFMGGEPMFNRKTLHEVTAYAANEAIARNVGVAFSITTNSTLLRPEDLALFQHYKFTVTVSIDGLASENDALRPFISGKGSFERVKEKVKELVDYPNRNFMVLARVTVTPKNLDLPTIMKGLFEMGFDSVKFSPMLKSPTGKEEMQKEDFDTLLAQMIACGETFKQALDNEVFYPVSNIISTLKRIHHFQREQYPCGAGGGYMGVSSKGELYACHRFVNDEDGHLGNVTDGVDPDKQKNWLHSRSLSAQGACNTCWARYMCSGSCHHEVIKRGRPACDYIRGWLHYCLKLYTDLLTHQPELLNGMLGNPNYAHAQEQVL